MATKSIDSPPGIPGDMAWLVAIVRRLLGPGGCPWDRKQTVASLQAYLIEECYEVIDAIDEGDEAHHCEELGDLLFQIVFQTELSAFSLSEVIRSIGDKLIHRHPHVFGDVEVADAQEVKDNWEKLKAAERACRDDAEPPSALDGVPGSMPALPRAQQLVGRAACSGFDWPATADARRKVQEELREVDRAASPERDDEASRSRISDEIGDLLLAIVGWARRLGVEPETALRQANHRFEARFRQLELHAAAQGKARLDQCELATLLDWWEAAKKAN